MILMRILEELRREPRGPTKLAQAVNLSFDKCAPYLQILETRVLIRSEQAGGRQLYSITQEGIDTFLNWEKVWEKLKP